MRRIPCAIPMETPTIYASFNPNGNEGTAFVDIKINGQDGTITVAPGTPITLSWTSAGVAQCNTGTSVAPWGPYHSVPVNGTQVLAGGTFGTQTFGIQCAVTVGGNMTVQDSVAVVVSGPTPQCSDGIDNDGDQLIDANDPGCHSDFNRFNSAFVRAERQ